jgi:hypothetical protein
MVDRAFAVVMAAKSSTSLVGSAIGAVTNATCVSGFFTSELSLFLAFKQAQLIRTGTNTSSQAHHEKTAYFVRRAAHLWVDTGPIVDPGFKTVI